MLRQLYQAMQKDLKEGHDVPYFDRDTGIRIGTIKKVRWIKSKKSERIKAEISLLYGITDTVYITQ